ncbi:signal recognition particle-docking protein FtsY [Endozoicomonas sp. Mp262]|uniref:signal recognition particle-docking protein FtsY n=1 Tax=Endozoicomonas sp. Mp262 TaxID=2919499 RepID=UPI0021D90DDA
MFGSRNDDEKAAKRRIWPWGRREEQGQSEESVEQIQDTPEVKDDLSKPAEVERSQAADGLSKDDSSVKQDIAKNEASVEGSASVGEGKLGLFARMRQKFEKPAESPESEQPATADPVVQQRTSEVGEKVEKAVDTLSGKAPEALIETPAQEKIAEPEAAKGAEFSQQQATAEPEAGEIKAPSVVVETAEKKAEPSDVVSRVEQTVDETESVKPEEPVAASLETRPSPVEITTEDSRDSAPEPEGGGFFARMRKGLSKTRSVLVEGVTELFIGKKEIDDDLLEELETQLLVADVGVEATSEIIEKLTQRVKYKELDDADALIEALKAELRGILEPADKPLVIGDQKKPYVILVVGVNGVGKTTTIGKLASRLQKQGKNVMLAAGDTFRAAAVEQLQVWGERNRIPVIAQHTGADSASVVFDAFEAAKARGADVLIADTAGRLHNKENLMEELKKVKRVLGKLDASAPHELLLVLDAGTGQNALSQAKLFHESVGLTGMALTKLDGTAKGGVIFALSRQMQLPIRFLGVGEQIDDLRPFAANEFVDALFDSNK